MNSLQDTLNTNKKQAAYYDSNSYREILQLKFGDTYVKELKRIKKRIDLGKIVMIIIFHVLEICQQKKY